MVEVVAVEAVKGGGHVVGVDDAEVGCVDGEGDRLDVVWHVTSLHVALNHYLWW